MSYRYGQVTSMFELLDNIVEVAQGDSWEIKRSYNLMYGGASRLGGVIMRGIGDGNDNLYIHIGINPDDITEFIIDASAGVDTNLEIWEQPGSIHQWNKIEDDESTGLPMYVIKDSQGKIVKTKPMPSLSITDSEQFSYFIFSNEYRIIVVCKLSINYQSMHLGFLNPISSEKQYPYPMYVGGNNVVGADSWPNNLTESFVFPYKGSGWLRRADGVWRSFDSHYSENIDANTKGTMFPYDCNNKSLVPNYTSEVTTDVDFLLMPILLHTNDPIDINGMIRGCYWISGTRDVAAEQIVVINGNQYMIFDAGQNRGNNSYFCIQIETD